MLDGVQAQPVHARGPHVPAPPPVELGAHLGIGDVDVAPHQVVVVAELGVDVVVPVLALEEPHAALAPPLVPVAAVEARPVPHEVRVGGAAPGEGVARPRRDPLRLPERPAAVRRVHGRGAHVLRGVAAHPVVEDDVGDDPDACAVQGVHGPQVLVLGAVLGGDGALLVELAQVVEVVDAVSDVLGPALALVGGRQPHGGHPVLGGQGSVRLQQPPVRGIGWQVPREGLQQQGVVLLRPARRRGRGGGR